jgi:hypothetical protein
LPARQIERLQTEKAVGLAKELGDETQSTVTHEECTRHLPHRPRAARIQPQQHEQQQPFEAELVQLRRMTRLGGARLRKHHRPRQPRIREPAPQLAVDEVADPARGKAGGHARRHQVGHLQERPSAHAAEHRHCGDRPEQPAVERHAALPDRERLQRVRRVIARLVEQHVAQPPADHHTEHTVEQQVFDIALGPAAIAERRP